AGPSAAPNVPASVQIAAPRVTEPLSEASTGSDPASSSAAPTPCTVRAAIRNERLFANAQAVEASRKTTSPTASTVPARKWCTKTISASATTATAALYEVTTQATPSIDVCSWP